MQSYCSYAGMKEKKKTQKTKNKEQNLIRKQYDRQIRKQRKEKKSNATLCPTREIELKKNKHICACVKQEKQNPVCND